MTTPVQQKPCHLCGASERDIEADDALKDDILLLCYAMKEYDEKNEVASPNSLVVPTHEWSFARTISFARKFMEDAGGDFQVEIDSDDMGESTAPQWIKVTWQLQWNKAAGEKKRKLG